MKDNSLDGHRGKVAALPDKVPPGETANATNFDDDYNEWELGIGDLIIDLDADIEKTNGHNGTDSFGFLGPMSNAKSPRLAAAAPAAPPGTGGAFEHQATVDKGLKMKIKRKSVGSKYSEIVQSDTKAAPGAGDAAGANCASNNGAAGSPAAGGPGGEAPNGNKPSKHSSGKGRTGGHRERKDKSREKDKGSGARPAGAPPVVTPSSEMNGVLGVALSPLKIGSPAPPPLCSNSSPLPSLGCTSTVNSVSTSVPSSISGMVSSPTGGQDGSAGPTSLLNLNLNLNLPPAAVATSASPPMPNLTLKVEPKLAPSPSPQPCPAGAQGVAVKQEEEPLSPPHKRIKLENPEVNGELDDPLSPCPEKKDASVCASVGTITEPDCLGPCEPGTSVMLEGIVWQETDGGVLVVNVTWRGKTYVGTLLDCTKHDWAPPRFCESPTSDVDAKGGKGRGGKRGRGGVATDIAFDARNCVQSKLRNGKGRRTTVNSASNAAFTVPNSPAKGAGDKRKGTRDPDLASPAENGNGGKPSKRNRKQQRQESPAPQPQQQGQLQSQPQQAVERGGTPTSAAEFSQPSSPVLIVCPEPHCGKKYKHINGLRYHQSHAHSSGGSNSDGSKMEESDSKDVTNSSDNEEGSQQEASNAASPSFANAVASAASVDASPGLPPAPEGDSPAPSADLPAAAEAKVPAAACSSPRTLPPQDSQQDGEAVVPETPSPLLPAVPSPSPTAAATATAPLTAVTTSVIQSSNSVVDSGSSPSISQAVTVSIPTSHVVFNQGVIPGAAAAAVALAAPSPPRTAPSAPATAFAQVASIASPSPLLAVKQEVRPDKYKPKSPLPVSAVVRPPVVSAGLVVPPPPTGLDLASPLKPKPPGPLVLGDPQLAASPAALDAQKREKSKHKKKSKDRERKTPSLPLTPTLGMGLREDCCEPVELTPYPSLETVSGSTGPLPGAPHAALSPLVPQPPQTRREDAGGLAADDSMNENMPSPAYSDISDANDTAPVLESEVAAVVKEKEDKVDKAIPDAAQSPAANINAYGMYTPYYSQPPYLIPSVSPQSAVSSGPQAPSVVVEKSESSKKDIDRIKENRPWSNPSSESRESSRQQPQQHPQDHPHEVEKKPVVREEIAPPPNPAPISSPAGSSHVPPSVQDYSLPPQHYPYPYGYVQAGYPYSIEPSSYHVHMLENDPHYKQQYKQYLEEQQRLYKEQQHHHHQQQVQQQHQHHGHHQSSSHHQGSKSQHHPMIKEERDRSRDGKESKAQGVLEYSSKIQHSSSLSVSGAKDHESRELDTRPPSLPAQQSLKEKRDENHQILKENIELKSQMESQQQQEKRESKINQYEMAMIYERHREDMRRYYMYQDKVIEQQQARMEPGLHHHTHLHQTVGHVQASPYAAPLKPHKEPDPLPHSKSNHYADGAPPRSSVVSPAKPDHASKASTSSPKDRPKDYLSSGSSSGKKERSESSSSSREDKKQPKVEPKSEPEGQKPTMETTGPPPPPTNSYAYLHPSYLQGPPHFPHMPFESAAHAMYRGGINPMIVSAAAAPYGASPYVHPQIRYVAPELAAHHPQAPHPEALAGKVLHQGPPKALDLLHHVSQQYTTTHKIHELQEHALMSPTPTSTPSSTPSSGGAAARESSAKSSAESPAAVAPSKATDASSRDASRSPPTQRHIHQHHHTHVGVGYPIYDPYGVSAPKTYT